MNKLYILLGVVLAVLVFAAFLYWNPNNPAQTGSLSKPELSSVQDSDDFSDRGVVDSSFELPSHIQDIEAQLSARSADEYLKEIERLAARKRETERLVEIAGQTPQMVHGRVSLPNGLGDEPKVVRIMGAGGMGAKMAVTDSGRFAFPAVPPGRYEVTLYETNESPGIRLEEIEVTEGNILDSIDLQAGSGTIELLVQSNQGPVQGANVTIGKAVGGALPNLYTYRRGVTDRNGRYIAEDLVDGEYVVAAEFGNQTQSSLVALDESEHVVENIRLMINGFQIQATVVDSTNRGLSGVPILMSSTSGDASKQRETLSRDSGKFALNYVGPGKYVIKAGPTGYYLSSSIDVQVTETGQVTPSSIRLVLYPEDESGSAIINVNRVPNPNYDNIVVLAVNAQGSVQDRTVPEPGDLSPVRFDRLPPGTYDFVVLGIHEGGKLIEAGRLRRAVDSGEVTDLTVNLK